MNLKRIQGPAFYLGLLWLCSMFVAFSESLFIGNSEPVDVTAQELQDGAARIRTRFRISGYSLSGELKKLFIPNGPRSWYVPLVPETGPLPESLNDVTLILQIHENYYDELASGEFVARCCYPQNDVPKLIGSRHSDLIAESPGLDYSRLWVIEPVPHPAPPPPDLGGLAFLLTMFIGGACFWLCQLLPVAKSRRVQCIGGIVSAALLSAGATTYLVLPRMSPWLNTYVAGTAVYAVLLGIGSLAWVVVSWCRSRFEFQQQTARNRLRSDSDEAPIVVLPGGFRVTEATGTVQELTDEDVIGFSHAHVYRATVRGKPESYTSIVKLRVDSPQGEGLHEFRHVFPCGEADPLDPFTDRLQANLARRWRTQLDRGERISVHGWTLDRHSLSNERGVRSVQVLLGDISSVTKDKGQLCVFRNADSRPFLCLPLTDENVVVLYSFLQQLVTASPPEYVSDHPLGAMVYAQRRPLLEWFLLPLMFAVPVVLLEIKIMETFGVPLVGVYGMLVHIAATLATCTFMLRFSGSPIEFRERGLVIQWPWHPTPIPYTAFHSLTWNEKEHCASTGGYLSTRVNVALRSQQRVWPVRFGVDYQLKDDGLERLREHLEEAIGTQERVAAPIV
jgi:hypothetical protein